MAASDRARRPPGAPKAHGTEEPTHAPTTAGDLRRPGGPAPGRPLPERIGIYLVRRELGRGGMGLVYEAEDPRLKRAIALKIVPAELAADPERRAQFEREAQILAAIRHPNVATIHSFEEADGATFLTMELVAGEPLSSVLARGALPLVPALRICRQVALALEAVHRGGVIHRDLKPQNIMLSPEGEVKLLDFGLAAAPAAREEIAGTPSYMSPEQWSGSPEDARVDVWAFGCVLYECLTGERALSSRPPREPGGRRERGDRGDRRDRRPPGPDLDKLPAGTPPGVGELIARCLAESPAERPESILVARRAIEEGLARGAHTPVGDAPRAAPAMDNLPRRLSPLIGRAAEKREVAAFLERERLVTLTGAGGTGKTRLALEVAAAARPRFPGGAWLVELAPLSDPGLLPSTVAAALGIQEEAGARTVLETLGARLAGRPPLLIVLDNAEHLLPACAALITTLLNRVSGIRFFVTSREPVGIPGEWTYHVRPLAVPGAEDAGESLAERKRVESVHLFVDRVRAIDPRFELTAANAPAVAQICRRLDGIPLALELAAARARVLSIEDIAERLGDRFRLLSAGSRTALPRHQTLRALIDWSHDQLTDAEQTLFRRLAAFAGGWTLEAAEEVAAFGALDSWAVVDLLFQLVSKSVVERDEGVEAATGLARYRMLETIRDYARERLIASGEAAVAGARHYHYCLTFAESAARQLTGPDQGRWLARLDSEQDNMRRAIDGLAATPEGIEAAHRIARALGRYWMTRGRYSEALAAYEGLNAVSAGSPDGARLAALFWLATFRSYRGDTAGATEAGEAYLAGCRVEGDETGESMALNLLGAIGEQSGDLPAAQARYEESLAIRRRIDNRPGIAQSLNNLGVVAMRSGDHAAAVAYYEESLAIRKERGDQLGIAQSLHNLGSALSWHREFERANACYEESLRIRRAVGDPHGLAGTLTNLGAVAVWSGRLAEARAWLRESLPMWQQLGLDYGLAETLEMVGVLLGKEAQPTTGAKLLAAAAAMRVRSGIPHSSFEQAYIEKVVERLRRDLGDAAFEEAWGAGQEMREEVAVALALGSMAT